MPSPDEKPQVWTPDPLPPKVTAVPDELELVMLNASPLVFELIVFVVAPDTATLPRATEADESPCVPSPNANAADPVREIPASQGFTVMLAVLDQQCTFRLGNSLIPAPVDAAVLFQEKMPVVKSPNRNALPPLEDAFPPLPIAQLSTLAPVPVKERNGPPAWVLFNTPTTPSSVVTFKAGVDPPDEESVVAPVNVQLEAQPPLPLTGFTSSA